MCIYIYVCVYGAWQLIFHLTVLRTTHKHQLTLHKLRHQRTAKKSATILVKSIASFSVMPCFPQKRLSNDAP